jgi:adenine-specific DNA-methyltransferase
LARKSDRALSHASCWRTLLEAIADHRRSESDLFDNRLIFGDNLLALKSLEQQFTGKVKCVFIDPPYNTGSAFSHYDDGLEHSIWLGLMRDRLEIIRRLLSDDGSLWITIDDNECHYLKVLCDEVFGRANFISNVVWQKKSSPQANATWLSDSHDHVLVYARNKSIFRPRRLNRTDKQNSIYKQSDEYDGVDKGGKSYGRGPWFPGDFTLSLASGSRGKQFAKTGE